MSVKDLSSDVTAQLRTMLKNDLGEHMKDLLAEMMNTAGNLADDLQSKVIAGFERTLEREVPKILESLQAIQKSVEGQAESPMERLLEQLQGVVAGGFKGESAQMSSALRQFAEVVPALAEQLRGTAERLTTDMKSRTDENVRASEALVGQVTSLLGRLEAQQSATEHLVENIARTTAANAEALVQRVHSEGNAMFAGLLKTSRADVDAILERLRDAGASHAQNYGVLDKSVQSASKSIESARDGLVETSEAIRALAKETKGLFLDARQTHEVAQRASMAFEQSASQLRQGTDSMRQAVEVARSHAAEQAALLEQHRKALKELEQVWPRLFETYIKSFDDKSGQLLLKWDEFYRKMNGFSSTVGGSLAEAAEELKISVDQLARLHNGGRT